MFFAVLYDLYTFWCHVLMNYYTILQIFVCIFGLVVKGKLMGKRREKKEKDDRGKYTLHPKSLHTFRSVWRKTTLNTDSVVEAGANPQTYESQLSTISIKMELQEKQNNFTFIGNC